jgi:hypothetical protein
MTESNARASTRERILTVLGTTQRPLRWAELTDVLGTLTDEARTECEWLMDHGYIAPIRSRDEGTRASEALWTFGDRGLAWAKGLPRSAP